MYTELEELMLLRCLFSPHQYINTIPIIIPQIKKKKEADSKIYMKMQSKGPRIPKTFWKKDKAGQHSISRHTIKIQ